MANCKKYQMLSPKERIEMIGKAVHCLQNDQRSFLAIKDLIKVAEERGIFEGVVIMPTNEIKETEIPENPI